MKCRSADGKPKARFSRRNVMFAVLRLPPGMRSYKCRRCGWSHITKNPEAQR